MQTPLYIVRSRPVDGSGLIEEHWRSKDKQRVIKLAQKVADKLGKSHEVWIDGESRTVSITTERLDWRPS